MKDKIFTENTEKVKIFIEKIPKKTRKKISIGAIAVVLVAIVITVFLNVKSGNYTILYSGLSTSETGSIYQALSDMGADVKFDSGGNILVPKNEYDIWILQLAAKGYPKTALTYDVFSSNAGMTATESEKAQWLVYQLQDRIQATLERIDGVTAATVTITIPETSNYVWETATTEQSASAGVLLSLDSGMEISGEQVSAIRTLIASSIPNMEPEDVTVVDAGTMLELTEESGSGSEVSGDYSIGFELMVQQRVEDNVVRLLSPRYGSNGVVAVAKVTIDYDKMMTEKLEMTPNGEDKGYITHNEGSYSINGTQAAGDIVGEDGNTDVPEYAYTSPTSENGVTDYSWSSDYDYSYIKTQIESGNAILKRATISVMVNESSLSETRVNELKSLVSGCTDIPVDLISISAFDKTALIEEDEPEPTPPTEEDQGLIHKLLNLSLETYIFIGVGALVLIIAIVVLVVMLKRKKAARERKEAEAEKRQRLEEAQRKKIEIENYKKTLEDIAKGKVDPKNEAIIEEVREFSKTNPQIAANLIRTWLKEN